MCGGGGGFGGLFKQVGKAVQGAGSVVSDFGGGGGFFKTVGKAADPINAMGLQALNPTGKKVDTMIRKDNPISRGKRQAGEAEAQMISDEERKANEAQAQLLSTEQNNNQTLQAETVALRRRKAAQSLLRLGSGARPDEEGSVAGNSNLARGAAYGIRQGSALGG